MSATTFESKPLQFFGLETLAPGSPEDREALLSTIRRKDELMGQLAREVDRQRREIEAKDSRIRELERLVDELR